MFSAIWAIHILQVKKHRKSPDFLLIMATITKIMTMITWQNKNLPVVQEYPSLLFYFHLNWGVSI